MNVFKILVTSIAYPFLYFKETLNVVTIPLLIFSLNWAVGFTFSQTGSGIGIVTYIIQFFAYSMLLTNCVFLVFGKSSPSIRRELSLYFKVIGLLMISTVGSFVLQYVLLGVSINIIKLSPNSDFRNLQLLCEALSQALVFWAVLIVPHFIRTGSNSFKQLFYHCKPNLTSLIVLSIAFQVLVYFVKIPFSLSDSIFFWVMGSVVTLIAHIVGCFLISFSYLGVEANATPRFG